MELKKRNPADTSISVRFRSFFDFILKYRLTSDLSSILPLIRIYLAVLQIRLVFLYEEVVLSDRYL